MSDSVRGRMRGAAMRTARGRSSAAREVANPHDRRTPAAHATAYTPGQDLRDVPARHVLCRKAALTRWTIPRRREDGPDGSFGHILQPLSAACCWGGEGSDLRRQVWLMDSGASGLGEVWSVHDRNCDHFFPLAAAAGGGGSLPSGASHSTSYVGGAPSSVCTTLQRV